MGAVDIFELHADFCKTLSNPTRLRILALLARHEMCVGVIAETLGLPVSNVSQHLTVLKSRQLVVTRKEGQAVFCRLSDPRIIEACTIIRTVLLDTMKKNGATARDTDRRYVVTGA